MNNNRYRVDESENGYYCVVDQKKGRRLRIENKSSDYMQEIADVLNTHVAEEQAENARLLRQLETAQKTVERIRAELKEGHRLDLGGQAERIILWAILNEAAAPKEKDES